MHLSSSHHPATMVSTNACKAADETADALAGACFRWSASRGKTIQAFSAS